MNNWTNCKKILCIRPDNRGDILMSYPAIRALKESFGAAITLLTSSAGSDITPFLPAIDDIIILDTPWVKNDKIESNDSFYNVIEEIKQRKFDAAVIFTAFSQNPLPSVMIPYLAGVPLRLAYCRENPYQLLTDWVPDKEPYTFIQHQVLRDLELVKTIGATTQNKRLSVKFTKSAWPSAMRKLQLQGFNLHEPWLLLHPGVSERKRECPKELWIETGRRITTELGYQVILTGGRADRLTAAYVRKGIGKGAFNAAGILLMEEFITLINWAPLVLTVNTSTSHLAAATGTPVIVLYALSNPQHLPWMARGKVFLYDVPDELRSKNEILQYVHENINPVGLPIVEPGDILDAARDLLCGDGDYTIPPMLPLQVGFEKIF